MTSTQTNPDGFDRLAKLVDGVRQRADAFTDAVQNQATNVAGRADSLADQVGDKASGAAEQLSARIERFGERLLDAVGGTEAASKPPSPPHHDR